MSQLDTIVNWTKKIESTLEKQLGAEGRGLHEKTSSVAHRLDARLVKLLRRIATIRNKSMHEEDYQVEDIKRFIEDCDTAHKQLIAIGNGKNLREVPAGSARRGGLSSSRPAFTNPLSGTKAFLLRELAFLLTPLSVLFNPGVFLVRAVWFGAGVIGCSLALAWAVAIFVLQPAWYEWIGIFLLLFLAYLASILAWGLLGGK